MDQAVSGKLIRTTIITHFTFVFNWRFRLFAAILTLKKCNIFRLQKVMFMRHPDRKIGLVKFDVTRSIKT